MKFFGRRKGKLGPNQTFKVVVATRYGQDGVPIPAADALPGSPPATYELRPAGEFGRQPQDGDVLKAIS